MSDVESLLWDVEFGMGKDEEVSPEGAEDK